MASTHHAVVHATYALSTRIRNASTSRSKRAPNAETVPVRRATWPSTASSTSATVASTTIAGTPVRDGQRGDDAGEHAADGGHRVGGTRSAPR